MSKVTVICLCILLSALAVIMRLHHFEQGLARAAYASCNGRDGNPLTLVRSE